MSKLKNEVSDVRNPSQLALRRQEQLDKITQMDKAIWAESRAFAGIDEAGRGPLAGPVAAGCVVMPSHPLLLGVNDSKRLSEKARESLYDQIIQTAVYWRVSYATVEEIDALNILQATRLAMMRAAVDAPCDLFLLDAMEGVALPGESRSVVHGDACCYSIAAASILAKVERDRLMLSLDAQYPGYGFAGHKGYGTAAHIDAIKRLGPCPAHRRLFIRGFVGNP